MVAATKIKSLADLRRIKEAALAQAKTRARGSTHVVVRLGTCGVAAEAHTVMQALTEEARKRELDNIVFETENCSELCRGEPFIDIVQNDAPRVTYGHVRPSDALRIVDEHLVNGRVVHDLVVNSED
ncbi:MAG: (2Fe-2S) ferredoxin domain-containing protein [Synergistaceae bacterium]|jgi:NADP-reducing hydrogenase subunit HndB|nr:(2Fe-2S) ferredoxin domain-containing protein [Synergistaceae bacterium]